MSYLNALASSGLTVGLRFNAVSQSRRAPVIEAAPKADSLVPGKEAGPVEAARSALPPLSPEERAAGRAEAQAQLAAEGVLGRLGVTYPEPAPYEPTTAEADAEAGEQLAVPGAKEEAAEEQPAESGKESDRAEGAVKELTPEEEEQVRKLAQRDQEVKAHEQAHVAASGGLAGTPSYEYQTGPDGRRYAVGGEVGIRRGGSSNTDQALREAEAVKRGATAPAQPSGQDMAVAARAEADIQRLRAKKAEEAREGTEGRGEGKAEGPESAPADQASKPEEAREDTDNPATAPVAYAPEPAAFNKAPMTQEKPANGAGFGAQAAGAYAAVKLGFQNAVRPLLAQI